MSKNNSSEDNSQPEVMKAIIASLGSFCRMELPDSAYIDLAINSVDVEDSIDQAEA